MAKNTWNEDESCNDSANNKIIGKLCSLTSKKMLIPNNFIGFPKRNFLKKIFPLLPNSLKKTPIFQKGKNSKNSMPSIKNHLNLRPKFLKELVNFQLFEDSISSLIRL